MDQAGEIMGAAVFYAWVWSEIGIQMPSSWMRMEFLKKNIQYVTFCTHNRQSVHTYMGERDLVKASYNFMELVPVTLAI